MKKNKIGKYSEDAKQAEEKLKQKEANEENLAKTYTVGARCQTSVPKQPKRRGVIMFIGKSLKHCRQIWLLILNESKLIS